MSADSDVTQIKVATARIEEQIKALAIATNTAHRSFSEQIDKLAGKESLSEIESRVDKLEAAQSWVVKAVFGTAITALAAATGLTKKLGL